MPVLLMGPSIGLLVAIISSMVVVTASLFVMSNLETPDTAYHTRRIKLSSHVLIYKKMGVQTTKTKYHVAHTFRFSWSQPSSSPIETSQCSQPYTL